MGRVFVVGSVNVDLVVRASRLPAPGETVVGQDLARHHGGKGGNQAVAAARLGAAVSFVGAVGRDDFGDAAAAALREEGVGLEQMVRVDRPTGVALIVVDQDGRNLIAVAPGANDTLDGAAVAKALATGIAPDDVVLVSREVPPAAVVAALRHGAAADATTILNPAPADGLDIETCRRAEVLTPNETELAALAGAASPALAAQRLFEGGRLRWLAVTLGAEGALLIGRDGTEIRLPAPPVVPVDTVGAGDTFNGALAALIAAGRPVPDALRFAVVAASLSTQRPGAREGMPTSGELERLFGSG